MEGTEVTRTGHPRFCHLVRKLRQNWKDRVLDEGFTKQEWARLFLELGLDPREKFQTNVCNKCFKDFIKIVEDGKLPPHEILVINDRLFQLLHDEECPCMVEAKRQVTVCLLELIAACDLVEMLKVCISQIQNLDRLCGGRSADHRLSRKLTIRKNRSSNSHNKKADEGILSAEPLRHSDDLQRFCNNNTSESDHGEYDDCMINAEEDCHHDLDSARSRCFEDVTNSPTSNATNLKRPVSFSNLEENSPKDKVSYLSDVPLSQGHSEKCDWFLGNSQQGTHKPAISNSSGLLLPSEDKDTSNLIEFNDFIEQSQDSYKELGAVLNTGGPVENVDLPGPSFTTAQFGKCTIPHLNMCEATGLQILHQIFCTKGYKKKESFVEELSTAEIHALKGHVDQASLLSMCKLAVKHDCPAMMSCVLALNPDTVAELVQFSLIIPISESALHLFHLSLASMEQFQKVPKMDLHTLEHMTIGEEHAHLCRLAWLNMDGKMERIVKQSRAPSYGIDMCSECCRVLFPENYDDGVTGIKFYRNLYDNIDIFDCIRARKCPCDPNFPRPLGQWPRYPKVKRVLLHPAFAAALTGNLRLLELLTKESSMFSQDCQPRKPELSSTPAKSCLKRNDYWYSHRVTFEKDIQTSDGSDLGDLFLHAMYGGSDECFHYLLQHANPKSLHPRVVLSCLVLSLRVGRNDWFLEIACKFGINLNSFEEYTSTPLMVAVVFERHLLVSVLLSLGADPRAANAEGETALDYALRCKDAKFLALRLLAATPDNELDESLMPLAIYNENFPAVRYLFFKGITECRSNGAIGPSYYRFLSRLPPSPYPTVPKIPLPHWIMANVTNFSDAHLAAAELFFSNSTDATSPISDLLLTPLHLYIMNRPHINSKVLDLLVKHGVSVNARTSRGQTALSLAITGRWMAMIGLLIASGASLYAQIDASSELPSSTMTEALKTREYKIVLFLLQAGYRCNRDEVGHLEQAAHAMEDSILMEISKMRCQPLDLTILCATALRENLQDNLNSYLETRNCPQIVRRFIRLEHLTEQMLSPSSNNSYSGAAWLNY